MLALEDVDVVLFHGDADGFCAAYQFWELGQNIQFVRTDYGEEIPNIIGSNVVIVDFSYDRETMIKLYEESNDLLLLDHHATAEEELGDLDFCTFDQNKSGAHLAYDYIHGSDTSWDQINSWIVAYVEDRDLYIRRLPDSREVSLAISSYPLKFKSWKEMIEKGLDQLIVEGKTLLRYQGRNIESLLKRAVLVTEFDGYVVPTINSTMWASEIGETLNKDYPFVIIWSREGKEYGYQLRSGEDGEDVSIIAKNHGGGGHIHASGFKSKDLLV